MKRLLHYILLMVGFVLVTNGVRAVIITYYKEIILTDPPYVIDGEGMFKPHFSFDWIRIALKNGGPVLIRINGDNIENVETTFAEWIESEKTLRINNCGPAELHYIESDMEFFMNVSVNYFGVLQYQGSDAPDEIIVTKENEHELVGVPDNVFSDVVWFRLNMGEELDPDNIISYNSSMTLSDLLNYGTDFCVYFDDETTNCYIDDDLNVQYYGESFARFHLVDRRNLSPSTRVVDAHPSTLKGGTVTGAGHYEQGTTATLTATAAERYSFANWTRNGEVVSTSPVYSFTVNEDYLLVANFRMMVPDIPDEPSDFDETKLYTLRTLHGYLSQSEELTGDGNGRSFLHSVPDKAEAGRFRIKGFKNKYTIYNEDLGRYLTAYGTAKTPYADEPDGSFTIYPAIDSGGSRMAWVIKSNTTDRWMNLGEIYLNNNIISGVDDDTQWFIEEYDETEEPNLPSAFDESVNYVLRTARGFLPRAERLASDNGFGDLWHIYSALDNYTAGQFRITGSEGAYHIYNLDLDKYLSADGTGNAAYVDQPDGTFSLITATDFGGKDNAWIIKSNVTGNWMMFGGSNQFLNNDGWNHADAGDQWYIEEVPPVGDMNGDGRVDVLDVTTLIDFINGKPTNGLTTALADINGDGRVDHLDLATLISIIIGK